MAHYTELHCHSCYSLREGASTPEELVHSLPHQDAL